MKKILTALACVSFAACGFSQCTANRVSAHNEWHSAYSVLVGTVISAQPIGEAWDFLDGVNYTVRVDSIEHGRKIPAGQITIFSENSPLKFPMQIGGQYMLYVQSQYDRYIVNNCGNSHAVNLMQAKDSQPSQIATAAF